MAPRRGPLWGLAVAVGLAELAAYAAWGWQTGHATVVRVLLAVGTTVVGAIVWWAFCSGGPSAELPPHVALGVRLAMLLLALVALIAIGQPGLGIILVFVAFAEAVVQWALRSNDRVAGVRG